MKAQVKQLEAMSHALEGAGFTSYQSDAVIQCVALAMETFAVTPEVLDSRVDKILNRLGRQDNEIMALQDSHRGLRGDITALQDGQRGLCGDIRSLQDGQRGLCRDVTALQDGQREMRGDIRALEKSMLELQKRVEQRITIYGLLMIGTAIGLAVTVVSQVQ